MSYIKTFSINLETIISVIAILSMSHPDYENKQVLVEYFEFHGLMNMAVKF